MKLFICGNGFDLHHGLRTSYFDYCRFLQQIDSSLLKRITNEESFSGIGQNLMNPYDSFWTDVESNYTFAYDSMLADNKSQNYPSDAQDGDGKWSEMEIDAGEKVRGLSKFSKEYFIEWIGGIDVYCVLLNAGMQLNSADVYVTFNYTDTLEKIYSIPKENVLHLHGDVSNPQFGNPFVNPGEIEKSLCEKYEQEDYFQVSIKPAINKYVNLAKDTSKDLNANIPNLQAFLSQKKIDEVIILGHSYNGVDKFYYETFFVPNYSKIPWKIYCRTIRDSMNATTFFAANNIDGCVKKW